MNKKEIMKQIFVESMENYFDKLYDQLEDKDIKLIYRQENGENIENIIKEFNLPIAMLSLIEILNCPDKKLILFDNETNFEIKKNDLYSIEIVINK